MPEDEEVKRGKWTFAHLPAIPSQFALKPIEKTEARLRLLLKLLKRKDVSELVNACDAGREGELIFRNIAQYAKEHQADPAPVAAVDDPGRHPRCVRQAAQRRGDAAAGRRRRLPVGIGLAGRHQRHARDDRVQLQVGRLSADDRRPRADADAGDPGRARGKDPRVRAARLLGSARHVPRRRRAVRRPLVRRKIQKVRRRSRPSRRASVGRGQGARDRRAAAKASRAPSPRRPSRRRRLRRCSTI